MTANIKTAPPHPDVPDYEPKQTAEEMAKEMCKRPYAINHYTLTKYGDLRAREERERIIALPRPKGGAMAKQTAEEWLFCVEPCEHGTSAPRPWGYELAKRKECRRCITKYGDMRAQEERERWADLLTAARGARTILIGDDYCPQGVKDDLERAIAKAEGESD